MIKKIFAIIFFAHCVANLTAQTTEKTVKGNADFAFELFKNIYSADKNSFISPYSISTALAMTYGGARNETERQMSMVMHYDLNQVNTHQGFSDLKTHLGKLSNGSSLKLSIANALWKSESMHFKKEYLDLTTKYYDASIYPLNGARPINSWAERNTNGMIKEIVSDHDLIDARLVLTNAIYFKGDWLSEFKEKNTRKTLFKTLKGNKDSVDMMQKVDDVNYYEDEHTQVLELPYKGESVSMIIILPKENSSINDLVTSIDRKQFSLYRSKLRKQEVVIYLPKFSFESEYHLESILPKMGMPDAFNPSRADFSGMSAGLSISQVVHKAVIEVNERGSEAAAVTSVVAVVTSKREQNVFNANRPFLIFICDKQTNSILFMGSVVDPAD